MCMSTPSAPAAPPPLPAQAPPTLAILKPATDDGSRSTSAALAANRGRSSLRIDRTQNAPGAAGSGLNIPS